MDSYCKKIYTLSCIYNIHLASPKLQSRYAVIIYFILKPRIIWINRLGTIFVSLLAIIVKIITIVYERSKIWGTVDNSLSNSYPFSKDRIIDRSKNNSISIVIHSSSNFSSHQVLIFVRLTRLFSRLFVRCSFSSRFRSPGIKSCVLLLFHIVRRRGKRRAGGIVARFYTVCTQCIMFSEYDVYVVTREF